MFTFSVLTISIVGLFFQIVSAITAYFLSQQLSLGEQMLKWHAIAYSYSCSNIGATGTVDKAIVGAADPTRQSELAGLWNWKTEIFNGTYNAKPSVRMVVTYVLSGDKPSGFSAADVSRQLLKITTKQHYRYGRVVSGAVKFTTYDAGTPYSIDITGLPGAVTDNAVVLVSDATCN
ncbi:MAG: hypothetical protein K2Q32_01090 [Alphaproteobacteria bacterium]|nr:hypothetical protein [Alphaproteobacteria bacterium]